MYEIMKDLEIPSKLIRLVLMTMAETENRVVVDGCVSQGVKVNKGLRQGDPLSATLFNIVLEKIIRESGIRTYGTLYNYKNQCLAYADDIVIMTRTKKKTIKN